MHFRRASEPLDLHNPSMVRPIFSWILFIFDTSIPDFKAGFFFYVYTTNQWIERPQCFLQCSIAVLIYLQPNTFQLFRFLHIIHGNDQPSPKWVVNVLQIDRCFFSRLVFEHQKRHSRTWISYYFVDWIWYWIQSFMIVFYTRDFQFNESMGQQLAAALYVDIIPTGIDTPRIRPVNLRPLPFEICIHMTICMTNMTVGTLFLTWFGSRNTFPSTGSPNIFVFTALKNSIFYSVSRARWSWEKEIIYPATDIVVGYHILVLFIINLSISHHYSYLFMDNRHSFKSSHQVLSHVATTKKHA